MRLACSVLAFCVFATGAYAREGLAELIWTEASSEGSGIVLMVRDADGAPIMAIRETLAPGATSAQIPVPPLTRQAATVQAGLVESGRVISQSPVKSISARESDLRLELRRLLAVGFEDHWQCEDASELLRITWSETGVYLRNGGQIMLLVPEDTDRDSFADPDGNRIIFDGNEAEVTIASRELGVCQPSLFPPIMPLDIAALDGTWSIGLGLETATLNLPGLEPDTVAASGLRISSPRNGEIRITGPSLSVMLRDELCLKRSATLPYPFSASLRLDAEASTQPGCAGNPLDLLAGAAWQVRSIYGQPLSPELPMQTLQISGSEISGRTACNRYVGTATVIDETLSFSELGATRLACPVNQHNLELRFLDALEIATGFDLWRNGGLSLRAGPIVVLTASRD